MGESLSSGAAPAGAFHSATSITHDFFDLAEEQSRMKVIREEMNFLHELVSAKLVHSHAQRQARRTSGMLEEDTDELDFTHDVELTETDGGENPQEAAEHEQDTAEGISYIPLSDENEADAFRLEMVRGSQSHPICVWVLSHVGPDIHTDTVRCVLHGCLHLQPLAQWFAS